MDGGLFDFGDGGVESVLTGRGHGDEAGKDILQRARDDRAEAQQITALTEQLTAAGVPVVDQPGYGEHTIKTLADLVTDQGRPIAPEDHRACPGHAAYVGRTWRGIEATHVCTDWKAHGHRDRYNRNSRPVATPMDEKAKAERKTVIARNRAWKSAETVRREWLATFLSRKTPPKGAAAYVAAELARGQHMLRRAMERGHEYAATLLSAETSNPRQSVAVLAGKASDPQAQVIALGLVLGAVEDSTGTHTWRNPDDAVKRYFAFLAANGYTLSEVERIAAGTERPQRRRTHCTELRLAAATSDTQALS